MSSRICERKGSQEVPGVSAKRHVEEGFINGAFCLRAWKEESSGGRKQNVVACSLLA